MKVSNQNASQYNKASKYMFFKRSLSMHIIPVLFAFAFIFIAENRFRNSDTTANQESYTAELGAIAATQDVATQDVTTQDVATPDMTTQDVTTQAKNSNVRVSASAKAEASVSSELSEYSSGNAISAAAKSVASIAVNPFTAWSVVNVLNVSHAVTVYKFCRIAANIAR